jgi:hypothetical protein
MELSKICDKPRERSALGLTARLTSARLPPAVGSKMHGEPRRERFRVILRHRDPHTRENVERSPPTMQPGIVGLGQARLLVRVTGALSRLSRI